MDKKQKRKQVKLHKQRLEKGRVIRQYLNAVKNFNIVSVFITKNEAENLPRLMSSLEGFADRVVVVDTGSTDNTVEVAKSLGAEVHEIAWPDSFSAARNRAIELAEVGSANWVAMFDADEVLQDGKTLRQKLRELPPTRKVVSLYHRTRFGHSFPRNCVFRPGSARWHYRFHEHLLPDDKSTQIVLPCYVEHPDDIGKNHDNDRIVELMRMDTVEHPTSATRKYYYGRQLFYRNDEACLEILKDVYDSSKWPAEAAQAAVFAGNLFEKKRDTIMSSDQENKQTLADEANAIAANFYRMAIAKYPRLRGPYIGMIRTTNNNYERLVSAATALKINQSSFFDDPPKFYSEESNNKLMQVIIEVQQVLAEQEKAQTEQESVNVSDAEAVS